MPVLAARDGANQTSISYLLRLLNPGDFVLGKDESARVYYSLSINAELLGPAGKSIYSDTQDLHDYLSPEEVDRLRSHTLAVAGRLPAVPGKYELRVDVTNRITKQSVSQTRAVLVPAFDHPLGISQVVFSGLTQPQRDYPQTQPFSFSGVKIPVVGADNSDVVAGAPLRVIFQLWEQPGSPVQLRGKSLEISYLIGQL